MKRTFVSLAAVCAVVWFALVTSSALAADAVPSAHDPVAAKRAVGLAAELRCLVCQNQSIAESNAELAVDLRNQIDQQIAAGKSDREIIDYMVARYGDFVLYRPPFKTQTLLLWLGPLAFVLGGLALLTWQLRERRRRMSAAPSSLSPAERAEAARLLASTSKDKP